MELYEVGGAVRDEIIGVKSKDIDYSVVLSDQDRWIHDSAYYNDPFICMVVHLERMGFDIKQEKPEYLTVRAVFPKGHKYRGGADFVLARKEADYTDGRRPDTVIPGTLEDDLARRDFTMNAIAKDSEGNLIDPFHGLHDINNKVIRAVGSPVKRLNEDALRGMRALRFAIQKGFAIDREVQVVLDSHEFRVALRKIATERVKDELEKMFKISTVDSIFLIREFGLERVLFQDTGLRLMPTMKG